MKGYFGIETELWNRIGSLEQKRNWIEKNGWIEKELVQKSNPRI